VSQPWLTSVLLITLKLCDANEAQRSLHPNERLVRAVPLHLIQYRFYM